MSLMSYTQLCELVEQGVIGPVAHEQINASSIDIRLGNKIIVERNTETGVVDPFKRTNFPQAEVDLAGGYYDLSPGEFVLAHSLEVFNLPNDISAEFRLKSSGARSGLNNLFACHCFVAGTKVPMLDGTEKSIEDIKVGDYVYSIAKDGKVTHGEVTFSGETGKVSKTVKVVLDDGSSFECTEDHRVMRRNGEYVLAKDLVAGDALMPFKRKVDATGYEKVYCPHMSPVGVFKRLHGRYIPTHKLIAGGDSGLTVHHLNENRFDNRPCNLEVMTKQEHIEHHSLIRNRTPEARERSRRVMKATITKVWQNPEFVEKKRAESSVTMTEVNKRLWADPAHRAAMRDIQAATLRATMAKLDRAELHRKCLLGHVNTAIKKLVEAGKAITPDNYVAVKRQNAPTEETIAKHFGSFNSAVESLGYENHSVVSVEVVEHEAPVPVYDITVNDEHNFALSCGVFVHNCDPGWHGSTLTLELHNCLRFTRIRLTPGMPIGQMLFHKHIRPVPYDRSYAARGRYNKDTTVSAVKE